MKTTSWYQQLSYIFCCSLALRWFAAHELTPCLTSPPAIGHCFRHDGFYYYSQGQLIGDGFFFKNGWIYERHGELVDSALHPPGFSLLLGAWSAVGFGSISAQEMLLSLVGATTVIAVAVLARRLGGGRAGLAAGWLAAAYPPLWLSVGLFTAEALYHLAIVLVVVAAYAYVDLPSIGRVALLGAAVGAAALVRGEAVLLWSFLLVPLVWGVSRQSTEKRRWVSPAWAWPGKRGMFHLSVGSVAALVVVSPWVVYLNATFNEAAFLTTAPGRVLLQGSCDSAWHGDQRGYVGQSRLCFDDLDLSVQLEAEIPGVRAEDVWDVVPHDETEMDRFYRTQALDYIWNNLGQYPSVMLARVGRAFGLYRPVQTVSWDWLAADGPVSHAGPLLVIAYGGLAALALRGTLILRRAGKRLTPLLSMWAVVAVATALTVGITRYRAPVDVAMVVLGGIGLSNFGAGVATSLSYRLRGRDVPTKRQQRVGTRPRA